MRLRFGSSRRENAHSDSAHNDDVYTSDALSAEFEPAPSGDTSGSDADMAEAIVAARRTEFAALSDLNDKATWSDVA